MARAGQGMDFFRFICDVEKENQKENGGSFPGFGFLAGIFAQKNHFEVKKRKHHVQEKLFLKDDAFWWEFFRYNHKIALNLESSWSFFRENSLFWLLFLGNSIFLGNPHLLAYFRGNPHHFAIISFLPPTDPNPLLLPPPTTTTSKRPIWGNLEDGA